MRRKISVATALVLAASLFAGEALAQELEGIVVQATRVEQIKVRTTGVVPEYILQASYRVTYDDLDVNTKQGRDEVKQRIDKAADLACKEIEREYPLAQPDHQKCAYKAASDAMEQFRTRLAAR
jgi:UrcA family protein